MADLDKREFCLESLGTCDVFVWEKLAGKAAEHWSMSVSYLGLLDHISPDP